MSVDGQILRIALYIQPNYVYQLLLFKLVLLMTPLNSEDLLQSFSAWTDASYIRSVLINIFLSTLYFPNC